MGLISLFCLVPVVDNVFNIGETQETRLLVIEDLRTGRTLWWCEINKGDEILYSYIHSVYKDRVNQVYQVSPSGSLILLKVASSPRVLFTPYPGFELSSERWEGSADLIEVKINKQQDDMVIAVGGELTNNKLTVAGQSVDFAQLTGEGTVVRVYVTERPIGAQ